MNKPQGPATQPTAYHQSAEAVSSIEQNVNIGFRKKKIKLSSENEKTITPLYINYKTNISVVLLLKILGLT